MYDDEQSAQEHRRRITLEEKVYFTAVREATNIRGESNQAKKEFFWYILHNPDLACRKIFTVFLAMGGNAEMNPTDFVNTVRSAIDVLSVKL